MLILKFKENKYKKILIITRNYIFDYKYSIKQFYITL